ncbi:MFS family permease [Cytobacillus horneckiae]|uniref:MFS transporter n=1 Tax=Cytobacillus horneckiae TaxID=549687 RepID=A0A2N0ZMQ3_9BACI|nr:MFS transporter [Cytobacillus horneckiae]PKG30777.1 MFS transporter [Cytobacillus horneckiae]
MKKEGNIINSIFKNRSFLFIWSGNAISELGGAFGTFCNSILIYQMTGSTAALGSMWLLYFIPSLLLQLFIGPFIDRWSRKWLMICTQWVRGFIFLLPLILLMLESLTPLSIYIVQMIIGLVTPIYTPANQAMTPTIVTKTQLSQANSIIDGTVRIMTFLAPLSGGFVIEFLGIQFTFILIISLLLISGSLLLFVSEPRRKEKQRGTWMQQFMKGITFFFKNRIIAWLGVFLAFVQFGVGVTMVITLPYITNELSGSYSDYGMFMASFPLGYIIGSLLVVKMKIINMRTVMLSSLAIGGLTFIFLGLNNSFSFAILTEVLAGIAMAIFNIHNLTIFQQVVPNELFGKVSSVRLLIIRGVMPLGVLCGGFAGEWIGIRGLYIMIGGVIVIVAFVALCHPYFKFLEIIDFKSDR